MKRKRLIFSLLYQDGYFVQSRNFNLQKVGNVNWLLRNYHFEKIAKSIDELIILNISRNRNFNNDGFFQDVEKISKKCFIPKVLGGGISSVEDAKKLFDIGADKIVLNTLLFENKSIVLEMVNRFGSQAIAGSFDYKLNNDKNLEFYYKNGTNKLTLNIDEIFNLSNELQLGEIIFQSINLDGTGFGFDKTLIDLLNLEKYKTKKPILLCGGAGNSEHFLDSLNCSHINAVITANLLNFIGDSLSNARNILIENNVNLPRF